MALSLGDYIGISHEALDGVGCFDTILDLDSMMFVNFLRVRDSDTPELAGAYDHIAKLFRSTGHLLASCNKENDRFWREAYKRLEMSEFEEICLGYSSRGTAGSGSGSELKRRILSVGKEIIEAGLNEPEIFELVGLFEDNIGPDRISDFIARTIQDYLLAFSKRILVELGISPKTRPELKFTDGTLLNPFNQKKLLLLPKDLLHELPIAQEWEDISMVCMLNAEVRKEINDVIGENWKQMTAARKKAAARKVLLGQPALLRALVEDYRNFDLAAYDFDIDPLGESSWYGAAKSIAEKEPLRLEKRRITNLADIKGLVLAICYQFKVLVEDKGLNEVLYADGQPRKERIAQRLFLGIADAYCKANDLDISPETNSGRGAVDFKISAGYEMRVIVETKLSTNSRLAHGYEKQIGEYKKAENNAAAIYLVIDNGGSAKRVTDLVAIHNDALSAGVSNCDLILVNGRMKASASLFE
jgi:hypothetical protein